MIKFYRYLIKKIYPQSGWYRMTMGRDGIVRGMGPFEEAHNPYGSHAPVSVWFEYHYQIPDKSEREADRKFHLLGEES